MCKSERWLVVGLGNPGRRYVGNRHNVGFHVIEAIAAGARGLTRWREVERLKGRLASLDDLGGHPALLLEPLTYMNLSGESVLPTAEEHGIPVERIIAIHDDLDLPPGRLKLKRGGGDGGHKGIRSMTELLRDGGYVRLRIGVGRPIDPDVEVVDFVLSDFDVDERETIEEAVTRAAQAVQTVIASGLKEAMNRFNRAPKTPPTEPADPAQNTGSTG
ncbi:MAG: aminoacyl-tRNA hydrolase [Proteobacteria bacterium]|nr:MAG: aminoacyl-tRNA hydrolase [Pseudomonadota bacterium]PIE17700.1 MAG: aminoacyl-tRNA hydrolase [Pseudomonadota bacterium]